MQILPLRTDNQSLTGSEFIDYLNRLERIAGRAALKKGELEFERNAGASGVTPGNEAAIQEGTLPASGPLEEPLVVPPGFEPGNQPKVQSPTQQPDSPDEFPEPVNAAPAKTLAKPVVTPT